MPQETHDRLQRLLESDVCQAQNLEELRALAHEVADRETAKARSGFFKALADEKRLRILCLLRVREMCVCELTVALDLTQPNLSHHIKILEKEGIVTHTKKGKWAFYSITSPEIIDFINKMQLR